MPILSLNEYQKQAVKTAIYPRDAAVIYPALGLCGETGEVAEKVKKSIRDEGGFMSESRRDELGKELGDVLWYLSNLASDLGFNLGDIALSNLEKLASRAERGTLQGSGDNR